MLVCWSNLPPSPAGLWESMPRKFPQKTGCTWSSYSEQQNSAPSSEIPDLETKKTLCGHKRRREPSWAPCLAFFLEPSWGYCLTLMGLLIRFFSDFSCYCYFHPPPNILKRDCSFSFRWDRGLWWSQSWTVMYHWHKNKFQHLLKVMTYGPHWLLEQSVLLARFRVKEIHFLLHEDCVSLFWVFGWNTWQNADIYTWFISLHCMRFHIEWHITLWYYSEIPGFSQLWPVVCHTHTLTALHPLVQSASPGAVCIPYHTTALSYHFSSLRQHFSSLQGLLEKKALHFSTHVICQSQDGIQTHTWAYMDETLRATLKNTLHKQFCELWTIAEQPWHKFRRHLGNSQGKKIMQKNKHKLNRVTQQANITISMPYPKQANWTCKNQDDNKGFFYLQRDNGSPLPRPPQNLLGEVMLT